MTSMLEEYNAMSEEKHMEICRKADKLQKALTEEDKEAIVNDWNLTGEDIRTAEKAAELIARDYGETLRRLGNE